MEEFRLRSDREFYYQFCEEFISLVVGPVHFKSQSVANKPFNLYTTNGDEAFALLCLDNVLDICKDAVRSHGVTASTSRLPNNTLYTSGKGVKTAKYKG